MASKRMFSKVITESDFFLDMPLSTQALYFHLAMQGDDDGFVNSPNKIMRMIGAQKNEFDMLVAKKFIITFDDGVVVIKHWFMHNYIRSDRYKPTVYTKEKEMLFIKSNNAYTLDENEWLSLGIPTDDVNKVNINKINLDKNKTDKVKPKKTKKQLDTEQFNKDLIELFEERNIFEPLITSINEFIDHRKLIKKPMNILAVKKFLNKLEREAPEVKYKIELIDEAIANGWQTVYPKPEKGYTPKTSVTFADID